MNSLKKYYCSKKADVAWFYIVLMVIGLIGLIVLLSIIGKSHGKMAETVETFRNWFS